MPSPFPRTMLSPPRFIEPPGLWLPARYPIVVRLCAFRARARARNFRSFLTTLMELCLETCSLQAALELRAQGIDARRHLPPEQRQRPAWCTRWYREGVQGAAYSGKATWPGIARAGQASLRFLLMSELLRGSSRELPLLTSELLKTLPGASPSLSER